MWGWGRSNLFNFCGVWIGVWIGVLVLWLLPGCAPPPDQQMVITTTEGPFTSSQVKPPARALAALEPTSKDPQQLARQAAYFKQLAAGQVTAAEKAKRLGPAASAPLQQGVRDLRAGVLPHLALQLSTGQRVSVRTAGLSAGADTVLHLWSRARRAEVAFDDDSGAEPGASALTYTAEAAGVYTVIVRAYSTRADGRCKLYVNNTQRAEVSFGGAQLPVAQGRTVHAVLINDRAGEEPWPPSPRAATDPLLLLLDPSSGRLKDLDDDSGVELGARLAVGQADAVALVGALRAGDDGGVRLVVDDAASGDTDGDGLGDGLEAALCLCDGKHKTVCGFDCSAAVTPQDSDGDGLRDDLELLGLAHANFPQLLPRWGADPRHKDLFVEIDLADWTDTKKNPPERHLGRTLTTTDAHAASRVFAALTAMRNPDGADGIDLHLDLGHPCGASPLGVDAVCGELCALGADGVRRCGQSKHPGPPTSRRDGLAPGRRHLFHVAVADCQIAGQAPGAAADHLEFDCDRVTAMVHELGHNLGLSHHYGLPSTGGGNCKPSYPSVMNYAFSDRFSGGRQPQFSDGSLVGAGDLDPLDLDETKPLGGPTARVGWLAERPFYYTLHDCAAPGVGCKVDFNRDGQLDPAVRAYLSPMPNYGYICAGHHGNTQDVEDLPAGAAASAGPAAAELRRQGAEGTLVDALYAVVPVAQAHGAGLMLNHTFDGVGGWQGWQPVPGGPLRVDAQPAALTVSDGAGQRLIIAACRAGAQPVVQASVDAKGALSPLAEIPGQPAWLRCRDVTLARVGVDLVLLVRDARPAGGDRVYISWRRPTGWSGSIVPLTLSSGAPLRSTVTPAAAAGPDGRLYIMTADPDPPPGTGPVGRLHLYSGAGLSSSFKLEDEELSGVRFEDGTPDHEHVPWSRPAMAFVPHLDGQGRPLSAGRGYLAVWWTRGTRVRYLWTWGRLDRGGADFSLGRWHHYEAMGYTDTVAGSSPALLLRGGARLSALISQSRFTSRRVRHVPYADGLPRLSMPHRDYDDRPVIRDSVCAGLNWRCRSRCKKLTDPCTGDEEGAPATTSGAPEVRCSLPDWSAGGPP